MGLEKEEQFKIQFSESEKQLKNAQRKTGKNI